MDINIDIPEKMVEYDETNYYALLTKKECDDLDKIQKRYEHLFRVRKGATSSLIKLILENTYLYINNNEIDIDDDIKNLLTKKYYLDIDEDFKKMVLEDKKVRDFVVELVRTRLLKKYMTAPMDSKDDELIKKQFRLSKEDSRLASILMGSKALSSPEYISSLIRYFLHSNTRAILYYKELYIIDKAINNKEYLILDNKKIKPVCYFYDSRMKYLYYFDEAKKTVGLYRLGFIIGQLSVFETYQKYVLSSQEENLVSMLKQLTQITITYELVEGINVDEIDASYLSDDNHLHLSNNYSKTIDGNITTIKSRFSKYMISSFEEYENNGYIKNLSISENYRAYMKAVDEYENKK